MKFVLFIICQIVFTVLILEAISVIPYVRLICNKVGTQNTCRVALADGW